MSNGNGGVQLNPPKSDPAPTTMSVGDRKQAMFCIGYLLLTGIVFAWLLLDTWTSRNWLLLHIGFNGTQLSPPTFRVIAFTIMGGVLGGTLNGIRSVTQYFQGFRKEYIAKYLTAPWTGGLLALIVFALIRSGSAVFGGGVSVGALSGAQTLSNFAIGALVGYGAKDVLIWLDARVSSVFTIQTTVPNVKDKPVDEATAEIQSKNLGVGKVTAVPVEDNGQVGKVLGQVPSPNSVIGLGQSIDLSTGVADKGK